MLRVSVVTDAVSTEGYFPIWCRYYGDLFGRANLHVVTYPGFSAEDPAAAGVRTYPSAAPYNDDIRLRLIGELIAQLLRQSDIVIRCDTDEFILPDPARHADLREFVERRCHDPGFVHCTAIGYDVIQLDGEAPLELTAPILAQRRAAMKMDAMNKTCIVAANVTWTRGFHYCTLPPRFDDLYLLHLKRADVAIQIDWCRRMLAATEDAFVQEYYRKNLSYIESFHSARSALPLQDDLLDWQGSPDASRFLDSIRHNEANGIYGGTFEFAATNSRIPEALHRLL